MAMSANLGFPRIGRRRELKQLLEAYWAGQLDAQGLESGARALRLVHWRFQAERGIDHIPSNDFSLYDHVLDTAVMVGAIPARFRRTAEASAPEAYFAMARGGDQPAMEMTKWLDTNYHYIVPEFEADTDFRLGCTKAIEEFREAREAGIHTRPVLLGPVSFLHLGKERGLSRSRLSLLPALLPVYEQILDRLASEGADWIQMDEPCLALDPDPVLTAAIRIAYARLGRVSPRLKLLLAAYFAALGANLALAFELPVAGVHLDLVRAPDQIDEALALAQARETMSLSFGLVDGRNVWRTDLFRAAIILACAREKIGPDRIAVAPSCSLMHCPMELEGEARLDATIKSWLAFAAEKLDEVALLARYATHGGDGLEAKLGANARALASRRSSPHLADPAVRRRVAGVETQMARRQNPYTVRRERQDRRLGLPPLPTTTIGSFPQTARVRTARAEVRLGARSMESYQALLRDETARAVRQQEEAGVDVLVHGEFERTDMVEYFGARLSGFAFTDHGWVQSYGSRCVKPPIIYGDVWRPEPMTVEWARYAQALTERPVKGMLTGPVTMLQWSFVRDDQSRADTSRQIALAIRDEVADLEAAGLAIIQIDEPALREGMPLHRQEWAAYLEWAVETFRLSASGVADETQIHTHMCYSEFNDIIEAVAKMDADVVSIESSRSQMDLLEAFARFRYPNGIGPGVYDIHSPRVPSREEIIALLEKALRHIPAAQLWVNPDCGLKTRTWDEVVPALRAMVEAAQAVRRRTGA
jgi:5-methyltetrahydropteroyltriglutamate--homocysteine methyltransferase